MAPILRAIADSGIRIVYAEPLSRHPPGLNRHKGIGLKKAGTETWEDLYDVKLFQLEWTIQAPQHMHEPGQTSGSVFLPRMGMPPREPTPEMMALARAGQSFQDTTWFIYASVMKAVDALPGDWIRITPSLPGHPAGDDVVISLPDVAIGLQDSMKYVDARTREEVQKKFEFRTALPEHGSHTDEIVDLEHLYFIQLLPNELPSYHFFATERDTPTARTGDHHDLRVYTWFSTNANTSNPDSNKKQGLRKTSPPADGNGSSTASAPTTTPALGPGNGQQRSAKKSTPLSPRAEAKVILKKRNKKIAESTRLYKPHQNDYVEVQEVKINKRKPKVSEDLRSCKPEGTRGKKSRK